MRKLCNIQGVRAVCVDGYNNRTNEPCQIIDFYGKESGPEGLTLPTMDDNSRDMNRFIAATISDRLGSDVWPAYQVALTQLGLTQRTDEALYNWRL